VIRLETSELESQVRQRIANCLCMCAAGVPFVMPARPEPMPVAGWEGLVATAWEYVEPVAPLDWVALGDAVRRLHGFEELEVDGNTRLTERLAQAIELHPPLEPAVAGRFRDMVSQFEAELTAAGWYDLPVAAAHGDLWTKNVIPSGPGRVVLCDADLLGVRPVACDLGILHREIGGDDRWEGFAEGYGRTDVPPLEHLAIGLRASILNWTIYVLERRRDWADYIDDLSKGKW
jgi:hypothetical protein